MAQVTRVALVRQPRILLLGNFLGGIEVRVPKLVHQGPPEVGCVGDVGDLVEDVREAWEVDNVLEAAELDVLEALLHSHGAQSFAICPGVSIGDGKEVYERPIGWGVSNVPCLGRDLLPQAGSFTHRCRPVRPR